MWFCQLLPKYCWRLVDSTIKHMRGRYKTLGSNTALQRNNGRIEACWYTKTFYIFQTEGMVITDGLYQFISAAAKTEFDCSRRHIRQEICLVMISRRSRNSHWAICLSFVRGFDPCFIDLGWYWLVCRFWEQRHGEDELQLDDELRYSEELGSVKLLYRETIK